jgi:hypothetical protein
MKLHREYPHIQFRQHWALNPDCLIILGQCDAYVKAISNTPIMPAYYDELMHISLIKGAQATTAIEGNTLTDEEIERLQAGEKLPPSRAYQETEVRNILDAFNSLLQNSLLHRRFYCVFTRWLVRIYRIISMLYPESLGIVM